MARIAVGGFQHETNTFSPIAATLDDFLLGAGWPGMQQGQALIDNLANMNLPIGGALSALATAGHTPVPLLWTAATPSGRVMQSAYDRIAALLLASLRQCGPVDGIYLDLHGAMATTGHDDGEAALLKAIRRQVGQHMPLVVSLDLHANVSHEMFAQCDAMVAYRTYPHVDMAETGARAASLLLQRMASGAPLAKAFRQIDFLIALTSQCTLGEPAASLYRGMADAEVTQGIASLSLALGFPLADIAACGPSVFGYGADAAAVTLAVDRLADEMILSRPLFDSPIYDTDAAIDGALRIIHSENSVRSGPVILADTQDNPGGGGASDTTGLLQAFIARQLENVLVAVMFDPAAARAAHAAGAGASIDFALGGHQPGPGAQPVRANWLVETVACGQFTGTGPMWGGSAIDLGPMALLRIGGVHVIVSSRKMQAADQSILLHMGVDPLAYSIIALKSSVHFRAAFDPIAIATLVVASPGLVTARLSDLAYHHLRSNVRDQRCACNVNMTLRGSP